MNDTPRSDTERYLIAGMLFFTARDADLATDALSIYPPSEWVDPNCKIAAETLENMLASGDCVDLVTFSARIRGKFEASVSWAAETSTLWEAHIGPSSVRMSAEKLHREHIKSVYQTALHEALHLTQNPFAGPDEVQNVLRDCLAGMEAANDGEIKPQDQIAEYFSALETGEVPPVSTPWSNLNSALAGGVAPGELVIVGARPSIGKSALAINWAWHSAAVGGNVVMFSLEMSRKQVFDRIAAKLAQVALSEFRGRMTPEAFQKAIIAHESMAGKHIHVDERGMVRPAEIRRICRAKAKTAPLSLVVIDYLQLVTPDNPTNSREQDVSGISRQCKLLAKDLNVPVILLSQLNRECEKHGREPILADLRESGAIEQDADIILFLHCKESEAKAAQQFNRPEPLKVIVAKGRSTGRGDVGLNYDKTHQNIYDMTAEAYAAMKRNRPTSEDNGL